MSNNTTLSVNGIKLESLTSDQFLKDDAVGYHLSSDGNASTLASNLLNKGVDIYFVRAKPYVEPARPVSAPIYSDTLPEGAPEGSITVAEYNTLVDSEKKKYNGTYINNTNVQRQDTPNYYSPTIIQTSTFHPNSDAYGKGGGRKKKTTRRRRRMPRRSMSSRK